MRALLPVPSSDVDVHEFYARDWIGGEPQVRSNFVCSADGAATAHGKSEGLQTPGDNQVFQALRDLADVVLVGARTATVEGYEPITPEAERVAARSRFDLRAALPTAVISRSLTLDPSSALYRDCDPGNRTIVITSAASDPDVRAQLQRTCDLVIAGDSELDLATGVRALHERGLTKVLFEGGPSVQTAMLAADVVDELCLSITPRLVGPGAPRIVDGEAWGGPRDDVRLHGLLEEDGALFARYRIG